MGHERIRVSGEQFANCRRRFFCDLDARRLDPKRRTCDYRHRSGECGLVARTDDAADSAFASDASGFRGLPVFERHDQCGHCPSQRKVRNDNIFLRFEEHLSVGKLHKLNVRFEQGPIDCGNSSEEPIARPIASDLNVSHPLPQAAVPPNAVRV